MLKSKPGIALVALSFAVASAAPAFAWRMGGPEWLTMMQKIRADKADPPARTGVSAKPFKADATHKKMTPNPPRSR